MAQSTSPASLSVETAKADMTPALELLSDSESYDDVLDKLQDYFDGEAQLVWYIAPKRKKIFAYTSPDDSKTYKGRDIISAAPVVPELQFMVADMFT